MPIWNTHARSIQRMPDGKPNLNGVLQHPCVPDMTKDMKRYSVMRRHGDLRHKPANH
jgi:hypothetical protein